MRSTYLFGLMLCSALASAMLIASCSPPNTSNTNTSASETAVRNSTSKSNVKNVSTAAETSSLTSGDREFVEKAAAGGTAEVELGQVAVKNAKSPDVKKFGQRMIDDHTKAGKELSSLASSKGITPPAKLEAKDQATLDRLSKLSGDQFDKAYMKDMVDDHEKDVAEFQKQANGKGDPLVKAFASKTLPTLEEHLQMAKSIASKQK